MLTRKLLENGQNWAVNFGQLQMWSRLVCWSSKKNLSYKHERDCLTMWMKGDSTDQSIKLRLVKKISYFNLAHACWPLLSVNKIIAMLNMNLIPAEGDT
jgi:hypothetical protein